MKYTYAIILAAALAAGCGGGSNDEAAEQEWPVSAILAKAVKEPVKETVNVVGTLSARDEITVISEIDSTIREIAADEGQQVKKGDVLFRLDDVRTQAVLSEAEAAQKLAELTHERNKELLKKNTISQQAYDQAEANLKSTKSRLDLARDDQSKTTIKAPFGGTIGERAVSIGQFVSRGHVLAELLSINLLEVMADVPERYLSSLSNDLLVEFSTEAYPEKVFEAKIVYISPSVEASSRTIRIKGEVSNDNGELKPGMFGNVSIVLSERNDSVIIPESSVQMQGPATTVVRVNAEGRSEFAPVQTGKRSKGMVEVISGLSDGDIVVAEGWQKMGPGMLVVAAPGSEQHGVEVASPEEAE